MSKVYVIAQFRAKEGKEQELFEVLKALEPSSREEEGCLQYILTRQIDHPSATRSDYSILFNEVWADAASWTAHGERKEIQDFFQQHVVDENGLVADAQVTAYTDQGY
ncbi:antibiotic biosynthesis monooxygenase [Motilimonas cestriensis]|uniref:Antibiotic biosynthesis monooxygenase n=1 Tax=Motilimonas cestriensis TaxID=2742685 RepID=A0ABS8W7U5_9GAMM|nr:putative quinol monooxygenase [Motilimonas cestriensis]MCE2594345.1 antibiotic biosynthesis monooxygenase [Motilimonas cestriensis]